MSDDATGAAKKPHYAEGLKRKIVELEAEVRLLRAAPSGAAVSGQPEDETDDERRFIDSVLAQQGAKVSTKERAGVNLESQYSALRSAVHTRRFLLAHYAGPGVDLPEWPALMLDPDNGAPIPKGVTYQQYREGWTSPPPQQVPPPKPVVTVSAKGVEDKVDVSAPRRPSLNPNEGLRPVVLEVTGLKAD